MKLTFHRDALNEMVSAADFYEAKRSGLGRRFDAAVEAAFETVLQDPIMWPIHVRDVRKYRLSDFPYAIFYRVEGDAVKIISVMHQKREPDNWLDRL